MIELTCEGCGAGIEVKYASQAKTRLGGRRRFCCDQCAREHRGKLYTRVCFELGLLPVDQVAELLGVSEHRVNDYRKSGQLPATEVKVDGMIRACYGYHPGEVQRFLAARRRHKPGPKSADPVLEAAGELSADVAAAYCHVTYGKLMADRRAGRVAAIEHRIPGIWRPVYGFREADLDAYKRAEATRTDLWHRRNLDPRYAAKQSRARGGDGLAVAALAQARAADLAKRRGGRPRRDERAARWTALLEEHRYLADLAGERPGDLELCKAVALEDYEQHPADWSYDPRSVLESAARRIYGAIKRLR